MNQLSPRIGILEDIHPSAIPALEKLGDVRNYIGKDRDFVWNEIPTLDVVIVKSVTQVNESFLAHAKKLKIVARAGTGLENIDRVYAENKRIDVLSVPTGNTLSAAEFTIMLMLSLSKRLPEITRAVDKNDFRRSLYTGRELGALTVAILGLGNVGLAVAQRLMAFGCRMVAWDINDKNRKTFEEVGGSYVEDIRSAVKEADIISLHCTLNSKTENMLNRDFFQHCKKGTLLINTSRGKIIETEALLEAIENGFIHEAALDVIDPEPPLFSAPNTHQFKHPLLSHPRIHITPHIAASTEEAQKRISQELVERIKTTLIDHQKRT